MAVGAFQGRAMFAQQRKFGGFIVIESDLLPVFFVVAALALGSEFALVRLVIVFLVAGIAQFGRVFVLLVDMAFSALHVNVLAQQGEFGFAMVELSRLPVLLAMAALALLSQFAPVRLVVILFVT